MVPIQSFKFLGSRRRKPQGDGYQYTYVRHPYENSRDWHKSSQVFLSVSLPVSAYILHLSLDPVVYCVAHHDLA